MDLYALSAGFFVFYRLPAPSLMNPDKPQHKPPRSVSDYDLGGDGDIGALSENQQSAINLVKVQARKANELYIREHPEISYMLSAFMREALTVRPDDIREYAATFFTDPDLKRKIADLQDENTKQTRICRVANGLELDSEEPVQNSGECKLQD